MEDAAHCEAEIPDIDAWADYACANQFINRLAVGEAFVCARLNNLLHHIEYCIFDAQFVCEATMRNEVRCGLRSQ